MITKLKGKEKVRLRLKPEVKNYESKNDKTPKYTVKEVSEMFNISSHTIRYYDKMQLIPFLDRTNGNIRKFSDYALSWLRLVHCLRMTGLSIEGVKKYINMTLEGDSTIKSRAEIIFRQEKILSNQIEDLQNQMTVLKYKKKYYQDLLENKIFDSCNPAKNVIED